MTNEITTQAEGRELDTRQEQATDIISVIANAVRDPSVDVAKMEALLSMQERVMDREAKAQYIAAFSAMQHELPSIGRRGEIKNKAGQVQSKYSKFEDIQRVINPILQRHGFALSFRIGNADNLTTVEAVLSHVGGHIETSGEMRLPRDSSGSKNDVQGVGSAVSYGKRYTTVSILNLVMENEDDDGQTASQRAADFFDLEKEAHDAASCGIDAYARWFKDDIDKEQRRILADTGKHAELKELAAKVDQDSKFPGDTP